MYNLRSSIT